MGHRDIYKGYRPGAGGRAEGGGRGGYQDGTYLIRQAMVMALSKAVASLFPPESHGGRPAPSGRELTVVDIGGRGRPYADLLDDGLRQDGLAVRHLVIDLDPQADIMGLAESLPLAAASADVVLCTQVLEHVADPARAVSEMARVLKADGACLLSTHGTWFYHPDPEDYWRWTHAGLTELFRQAGFRDIRVRPVGGAKLTLAVLGLTALERSIGEGAAGGLFRRFVVAPANFLAAKRLLRRVRGRRSLPGELAINYVVTGRAGRS
ncbi:MAG: class I SAM-dependent methyltransferase [Acidobacteriota bacterium]